MYVALRLTNEQEPKLYFESYYKRLRKLSDIFLEDQKIKMPTLDDVESLKKFYYAQWNAIQKHISSSKLREVCLFSFTRLLTEHYLQRLPADVVPLFGVWYYKCVMENDKDTMYDWLVPVVSGILTLGAMRVGYEALTLIRDMFI